MTSSPECTISTGKSQTYDIPRPPLVTSGRLIVNLLLNTLSDGDT